MYYSLPIGCDDGMKVEAMSPPTAAVPSRSCRSAREDAGPHRGFQDEWRPGPSAGEPAGNVSRGNAGDGNRAGLDIACSS